MSFYINENPVKLTETPTAADRIRAKRRVVHITEDMKTLDDLVKSGVVKSDAVKKVVYPYDENFKEFNTPCPGTVDELSLIHI